MATTRSSCFVLGTEVEGGVHNVSITNFTCHDTPAGMNFKVLGLTKCTTV